MKELHDGEDYMQNSHREYADNHIVLGGDDTARNHLTL